MTNSRSDNRFRYLMATAEMFSVRLSVMTRRSARRHTVRARWQSAAAAAAARQDELLEWREIGIEPVENLFQLGHARVGETGAAGDAQLAAEIEQIVLDVGERGTQVRRQDFPSAARRGRC